MEVKRLFDLLPHYLEKYPEQKVALAGKQNGSWIKYSIQDYIDIADKVSYALLKLGVQKGDKVALISNNRPEWNFIDMGTSQIGAVLVPIYPTISEEDYRFILTDCEAKIVILDGISVMNKITAIAPDLPNLKHIYTMIDRGKYPYFQQLVELGAENPQPDKLKELESAVDEFECATIIYTSGTTGTPKGVMLSHHNLMNQFLNFCQTPSPNSKTAFSFLPICHAYERALVNMYHYLGMSIYYAESLATIAENMREIHPTMMCAVPRVLERFYDTIIQNGKKMKGISRMIFFWAMRLAEKYKVGAEYRSWWYDVRLKIADKLVFSKIRAKLGAENFDIIVSGAASISQKVAGFFSAMKMPVYEGYGLTETSPVIAVSSNEKYGREVGCVGLPLPGVEVKIADNGEIICRGHNVMMGYYKNEELTKEVIDEDGWFHTGDLGKFTEHGQLVITGRLKSLFKTSGGKYINPDMIEGKFSSSKFIEQILVVGENQKFAGAIIIPDFSFLKEWCKRHEVEYTNPADIIKNPIVLKRYAKEINTLNNSLGETEKIKKHVLLADEWSIQNGFLTPTLKIRRKIILNHYKDLINTMYGNDAK